MRAGDIVYNKMWASKGSFGVVPPEMDGLAVTNEYPTFRATDSATAAYVGLLMAQPSFWQAAKARSKGTTGRARLDPAEFLRLPSRIPNQLQVAGVATLMDAATALVKASTRVVDAIEESKRVAIDAMLNRLSATAPIRALGTVAVVQTGVAKNKNISPVVARSYPYLRVANVQDGRLDLGDVANLSLDPEQAARFLLRDGDVLFTEGGDEDKLGRGTVWRQEVNPCVHQNHVFVVRPDTTRLDPEFLSLLRQTAGGRAYFRACAKRTTNLASINTRQLRDMPVVLPPIAEQKQLVVLAQTFAFRIAAERAHLDALRELKRGLADALLSGRVRLPPHLIASLAEGATDAGK